VRGVDIGRDEKGKKRKHIVKKSPITNLLYKQYYHCTIHGMYPKRRARDRALELITGRKACMS
jgi:hypothetical protein